MFGQIRRQKKPALENYYKVLGTRANISQERIKEKYVAKLKENPPETHPEEFKKIREAYDTLRDPAKRKKYDITRKYGRKVERLNDDMMLALYMEDYLDAESLAQDSLQLIPNSSAYTVLSQIALVYHQDIKLFHHYMDQIVAVGDVDQETLITTKASILVEMEYAQEAYDLVLEAKKTYPQSRDLEYVSVSICLALDKPDEAINSIESLLPDDQQLSIDDLDLFIKYTLILMRYDRWELKPNIQRRIKPFVSNLDAPDRDVVISKLTDEYEEYWDRAMFRAAEFIASILTTLDPKNREFRQMRRDSKELVEVEKALRRLDRDEILFPYLFYNALAWYRDKYVDSFEVFMGEEENEAARFLEETRSSGELDDDEINVVIAMGIRRIKNKHPLIYAEFKQEWTELLEKATKGMNREERRQIMRTKG